MSKRGKEEVFAGWVVRIGRGSVFAKASALAEATADTLVRQGRRARGVGVSVPSWSGDTGTNQ